MTGRLVLASMEPGNRRIRIDGAEVGHCLTEPDPRDTWYGAWQSHLWAVAGDPHAGWVKGPYELRLRDLRTALEKRLAEGQWWK